MNDIIKNIEAAQLKAEVTEFSVGDTVRVHAKTMKGTIYIVPFSSTYFTSSLTFAFLPTLSRK